MPAQELSAIANSLLSAAVGPNEDQLRASLDLLCYAAASLMSRGSSNDFSQAVLVLLSAQDNFSELVRSAYLDLLTAWVQVGPDASEYAEMLQQTEDLWARIASPYAVNWAVGVLEALLDAPCPDPARRALLARQFVDASRQFHARLSIRERVDLEALAHDFGLRSQKVEAADDETNLWRQLDGELVGIYSLLPRAAALLQNRLSQLC